jgi:hypothetical protein
MFRNRAGDAQLLARLEWMRAGRVAWPDRLPQLRRRCDAVMGLLGPPHFRAVGQFAEDGALVEDAEGRELLRAAPPARQPAETSSPRLIERVFSRKGQPWPHSSRREFRCSWINPGARG